ncbi:MAG TPA: hypothetical protein VGS19_29310 [Streptosporangiaceae bacterium]|nr:hypothetical protein [Streptosporangiaceae bacterium]
MTTTAGITGLVDVLAGLVPALLVAVTLKVYAVVAVSPDMDP